MTKVNLEQAKTRLGELVDAVLKGETVILAKNGKAQVKLVPCAAAQSRAHFGSARGLVTMREDFDDPLPDFESFTS